ncbi:MAG: HEAT repeat domain-containing protein [Candidatus Cloacimonetes bacterium]|nr:HEAT repeat domain-containing protein [Candidatus Cloacimonadota bacterium]
MFKRIFIIICTILSCQALLSTELDRDEVVLRQLYDLTGTAELDPGALIFEKDWDLSTRFKTESQLSLLQNPWSAFDRIAELRRICQPIEDISGLRSPLSFLSAITFTPAGSEIDPGWDTELQAEQRLHLERRLTSKAKPRDILRYVEHLFDEVSIPLSRAFDALSPAQRDSMTVLYYRIYDEEEDKEKYASYLSSQGLPDLTDFDLTAYAALFESVNFTALKQAQMIYLTGIEVLQERLGGTRFSNPKPIVRKTRHGLMIIGGSGNDTYDQPFLNRHKNRPIAFVLEPSGNDRYEIPIHTTWNHPLYLYIDLTGDDTYRFDRIGSGFAVIGGLGCSIDLSGNDTYRTDDFAFSSFCGINLHFDAAGDDIYQSGLFSQGAAMFGLALLVDKSGNDCYSATSLAQGMGGVLGCGAVLDWSGNDLYYIGGKYLHKPLAPFDYRSLGQGMGFGLRPDYAGGLGLIYDHCGNDRYIGGVYAQGVGYWYATGMLLDATGNDVYNAVYYPQGSGIHLANGILWDGEGDDQYYSKNGPGQGAGHDWAFGCLYDGDGNDVYSLPGGNGLGLTNSVGIFIDVAGNDRYERRDQSNYGFANQARDSGGIGLFLDTGGDDVYPDTLFTENSTWQRGTYGIGRDIDLFRQGRSRTETLATEAVADVDSLMPIDRLFTIASEWEVGSAVQRVRQARQYLSARPDEAIQYITANKLATKSGLEYRTLEEFLKSSDAFKTALYTAIRNPDTLVVKNAVSLIAASGDTLLLPYLHGFLSDRRFIPLTLSVLGSIKDPASIAILSGYIDHPYERFRYIAARSLKRLDLPDARALLRQMTTDNSFLVQALLRTYLRDDPE